MSKIVMAKIITQKRPFYELVICKKKNLIVANFTRIIQIFSLYTIRNYFLNTTIVFEFEQLLGKARHNRI